MFQSLSSELKEAREKKGLGQLELAKAIKMDFAFLKRLENGDMSFLQPVFVRGFLKSYAKAVDLNEEIIVRKFELACDGKDYNSEELVNQPEMIVAHPDRPMPNNESLFTLITPKPPSVTTLYRSENPDVKEQKVTTLTLHQKRIIMFASLSLFIIAISGYFFYRSNLNDTIEVDGAEGVTAVVDTISRYETPAPAPVVSSSDSLLLHMEFKGECWVKVKPDSSGDYSENVYKSSNIAEFKASKFFIVNLGNYPNARLFLNNKELKLESSFNKSNSLRLEIKKDTAITIPWESVKSDKSAKSEKSAQPEITKKHKKK